MPFIETADRTSLFVTDWVAARQLVFTRTWGLRSDQWTHQIPHWQDAGECMIIRPRNFRSSAPTRATTVKSAYGPGPVAKRAAGLG